MFGCFLHVNVFIRTFAYTQRDKHMGLGSYWVRKDDQTGEAKTLKPWEEAVGNGDKFFPDPHKGEDETEEDKM